eukprot:ANDGO_08505.mRNA.1 Cytochrome B5-like protein
MQEISKHTSETDAWIAINGKVYEVSSWIDNHPGGRVILDHAGTDASKAFFGSQHPASVHSLIDKYFIGTVKA